MAIRCCGLDKSLPLPGLSSFLFFFFFCIFPETPIPLSFFFKNPGATVKIMGNQRRLHFNLQGTWRDVITVPVPGLVLAPIFPNPQRGLKGQLDSSPGHFL